MLPFCGFFLVFVGILLSLFFIVQRHIRRQWSELANATSLTFESEGILLRGSIFGNYWGRPILIDSTWIRINLRWTSFERVRLPLRDIQGLRIKVSKRGIIGRVTRKLQPPNHLMKSKVLSDRYRIEVRPSRFAKMLLHQGTPFERLLQHREVYRLWVENDEIHLIKMINIHNSKDKLLEIINLLIESAEFCEQTVESALPKRYSKIKASPSLSQFLAQTNAQDLEQIEEIKRFNSQSCVVLFLLLFFVLVLGYGIPPF